MPVQDFLITFRADTTGALSQINALATRVSEVDAALNSSLTRLERRRQGASPFASLTAGAPAASTGVQRISKDLLEFGRNIEMNTKKAQALMLRLSELKTIMATTTLGGRGPNLNEGRLNEAIGIIYQLRGAHQISAVEADKWAQDIADAYSKVGRVANNLRTAPVSEQARIMREARQTQKLRDSTAQMLQRSQGTFKDTRSELQHLNRLEKALGNLEARGDPVQKELDETRRKIEQMEQAAARAKSINQLLQRRGQLETKLANTRIDGGNDRNIVRSLKAVEEALEFKGAGSASRLDSIRRQFAEMAPPIDRARAAMVEFNRVLQQRVVLGERLNLPRQSAGSLTQGLQNGIDMMKAGMSEGVDAVEFFQARVANLPPTLDRVAQGMLNHGRRVAEGLFIYEALGRALQAVGQQIELINNLAREQIRFAAVAGGLGDQGGSGFLLGLQDIATRTNTPMDELAAQIDTVAAVMLDAGDATAVAGASLEFLNQAGQFTNITQRDLASETKNLLGIYNQTGDSVGDFADRLGRITVTGRNNSELIRGITDVLSEAGATARSTGFDFDLLGSLGGQMVEDLLGTMSGGEIGGLLNTVIGRLTDPQVMNKIRELSEGLISFSDAAGNLRDPASVLLDIFTALEEGSDVRALVLDQIIPPLSPGRRALIEDTLGRNLPEAVADMGRIMQATEEDARNLSEALVSGPGERFAASMKEVTGALTGIFSEEVIGLGNQFADILKTIAGILGSGQPGGGTAGGIASAVVQFTILIALAKTLAYVARNLSLMFGSGRSRMAEIAIATEGLNTAAGTGSPIVDRYGQQITRVGDNAVNSTGRLDRMKTGVGNLARAMANPLVLVVAIELVQNIPDIVDGFKAMLNEELSSGLIDRDTLDSAFGELTNIEFLGVDLTSISRLDWIFGNARAQAAGLSEIQFQNVENLARAMIRLESEGKLNADAQQVLDAAITGTNGKVKDQLVTFEDLLAAYNSSILSTEMQADATERGASAWDGYTEAGEDVPPTLDEITDAERRATEAMQINAGLSDARAAALVRLTEQLREGTITVDEWADGQNNAAQASESAANFIAAYGDQLAIIPGLQERMAQTGEDAATALLGMLMDNPDTINERIEIIDSMVAIADANAELATELENNPIEFSIETQKLIDGVRDTKVIFEWLTAGTYETRRVVDENPIEPQVALDRLKAQAVAALKIYKVMLQAQSMFSRNVISGTFIGRAISGGLAARTYGQLAHVTALQNAIQELTASMSDNTSELGGLGDAFGTLGGIRGDDPRLDSSSAREREPSQTGIIDIGDLPPSAIQQIIALASAAQAGVVGAGGVVDTDETAAIFKDAAFQTLIQGIDQRFLQQAIEELTEVEKKRLELEQARLQDVTRSLVTQVGPIQSIVSAPVLAAGGGLLSGQGLNADPRLGNFTINVPINWSGMNLAQLQEFIYKSISQAWIDAGRGA